MATLAEVRRHRQAVDDLIDLAVRELRNFWRSLGVEDPRAIASLVREFLPALSGDFALMSTTLAADWYEELREEAAVSAAFAATALEPPSADDVQDRIGYALVPLFSSAFAPETASDDALARLANLMEDVVASADRQTVQANAARDRSGPRYARHASVNACAFCRMLATRGADYRTDESATRVVLERSRNKRKVGEKYHDFCRCTAVPVWGSKTYEEAPYVADWREAYYAATAEHGTSDTKAILAAMRAAMGTR